MGDPLSIAASIVGLVSTGIAIVKGLYTVADALASSGKEIRAYGDELDGFTKVLNLVHLELTRSAHSSSNIIVFRDIANICAGVLEPFNRLQQTLSRLTSRFQFERSRWSVICGKIKWVFEKRKELLFWRDLLAQQHKNLHSALLVLVLHSNREGNAQVKQYGYALIFLCLAKYISLLEISLRQSITELPTADNSAAQGRLLGIPTDLESGIDHPEGSTLSRFASQFDPPNTTSSGVLMDSAYHAELLSNQSGSFHEAGDRVDSRNSVQQLALSTINNGNAVVIWNDSQSITDEEVDEAIQKCLDPDDGVYMHQTKEDVLEISQAIKAVALQALHTHGQNSFSLREKAILSAGGNYVIGIVCALPIELAAVRCMMTEVKPPSTGNAFHDNMYIFGRIANHEIALTCLPREGEDGNTEHEAFKIFGNMFRSLPSMLFAIFVGTASGCPSSDSDIRLADVVVGRPTDYGEAILLYGQDGIAIFRRRARLPDVVLTGIRILQAQEELFEGDLTRFMDSALQENPRMAEAYAHPGISDLLFDAHYLHKGPYNSCEECDMSYARERRLRGSKGPRVHYGPIASTLHYISDPLIRDRIASKFKVLCIEYDGSEVSCEFPILVIRGIYNYADSHTGTHWLRHAALAAAAYVKELLTFLPPNS